eukprot:2754499-Prymnesium_polylepis.2
MSAHERGREDAGAGRAAQGGEGCRHIVVLYTDQKVLAKDYEQRPRHLRYRVANKNNAVRIWWPHIWWQAAAHGAFAQVSQQSGTQAAPCSAGDGCASARDIAMRRSKFGIL